MNVNALAALLQFRDPILEHQLIGIEALIVEKLVPCTVSVI